MQTKEDLEFLIKLQKELQTQDIDHQAAPRFWVIADFRMIPCPDGYHEKYHVMSSAIDGIESLDDLLETIKEDFDDLEDPETAKADYAEIKGCEVAALNWLKKYWCEDAELVPVTEEHFFYRDTLFLTKAGAQEHLRRYHYNYSRKAHTYAMTAQKSPIVEELLKILTTFNWEALAVKKARDK